MAKYLDETGLTYLWSKIKEKIDAKADKSYVDSEISKLQAEIDALKNK